MICPSCGKENKEGSKFCKHCGSKLVANVGAAPASIPINSQPKDSKNTLDFIPKTLVFYSSTHLFIYLSNCITMMVK